MNLRSVSANHEGQTNIYVNIRNNKVRGGVKWGIGVQVVASKVEGVGGVNNVEL